MIAVNTQDRLRYTVYYLYLFIYIYIYISYTHTHTHRQIESLHNLKALLSLGLALHTVH